MTDHKHLKALIRSRMTRTGERYTTARMHLVASPPRLSTLATIDAHDRHCMVVRFSPDGLQLVSGGFSGQLRVWRTTDRELAAELEGHTSSVNGVALDSTGERAVTISSDRTVRAWDVPRAEPLGVLGGHKGTVNAVDLAPDGTTAATAGADGQVTLWPLEAGTPTHLRLDERPTAVAFAPDGARLAVASGDSVDVMDLSGERLAAFDLPGEASTALRWAPGGDTLTASATNGAVRVWSTNDWEPVRDLVLPAGGWAPLAIGRDGGLMAVAWEHHVGLWTADRQDPVSVVDGLPKGLYSVDFSPDGRFLALAGADGRIRLWQVG